MFKRIIFITILLVNLTARAQSPGSVVYADSVLTVKFPTEHTHTVTFQFMKCMANDLFTFSHVYMDSVLVNSAIVSDNIGPFLLRGRGWAGGNHLEGDCRTARTVSYRILVEGKEIADGTEIPQAGRVDIYVNNELIDPVDHVSLFDYEDVHYTVAGNSIQVEISHRFRNKTPYVVDRYYGMQSMMIDETELLTPYGAYYTWTPIAEVNEFDKAGYPDFSLFIEHSPACYQAAYMTREGLGDRHLVQPDDVVFIGNSWSKCYHKLMGGATVQEGDTAHWKGVYSWFVSPVIDTADVDGTFVYSGMYDGRPALFYATDKVPAAVLNY